MACETNNPASPAEDAFRNFIRTLGLMQRVLVPYFAQFGISPAQWGVLRAIHCGTKQTPQGLRLVDLSEQLLVRPPSVTVVVARLVRMGLVAGTTAADDHRSKLIRLTPAGKTLVDRIKRGNAQQHQLIMGGLSTAEQVQLRGLLAAVATHLERIADNGMTAVSMKIAALKPAAPKRMPRLTRNSVAASAKQKNGKPRRQLVAH